MLFPSGIGHDPIELHLSRGIDRHRTRRHGRVCCPRPRYIVGFQKLSTHIGQHEIRALVGQGQNIRSILDQLDLRAIEVTLGTGIYKAAVGTVAISTSKLPFKTRRLV